MKMSMFNKNRKKALEKSAMILQTMNVIHFLDQGTLLGAVRDGGFHKHDKDIDLGLFLGEFTKQELHNVLLSEGYEVKWLLDTVDGLSPQLAMTIYGVRVDFHCYFHDLVNETVFHYSYVPLVSWAKNVFPQKLFTIMESVTLADATYPAPSPVSEFLQRRYGDWETPKPTWDYMREPPCVVGWWPWKNSSKELEIRGQG